MPVSKKSAVCELSHIFDTFNQLHLIVEALWSQPVLQGDQGSKEDAQTIPSLNAPAVLEWEQLNEEAHCLVGALHRMSAFHAFCSK
jgi:hypothetical protein